MEFLSYLVKRFVLLVSERRDTLTRINRLVCVCRQQRALLLYIFFIAVRTHEVWDIQIKKKLTSNFFSPSFFVSLKCVVYLSLRHDMDLLLDDCDFQFSFVNRGKRNTTKLSDCLGVI